MEGARIVQRRYEYKYLLNRHEAFLFYTKVKAFSTYDKYCNDEGFYMVYSTYFDDFFDRSLMEKINGLQKHTKIRLRTYNDEKHYKLEVKEKSGDIVYKRSYPLSEKEGDSILHQPSLIKNYLSDYHLFTLLGKSHTVRYKRYVLLYQPFNVRITFDYEIACQKHLNSQYVHVANQDEVIVEIKFNGNLPDIIESLMGELGQRQSLSKYAASRLMY